MPDDVADLVVRDFREAFVRHRSGAVADLRILGSPWDLTLDAVETPVRLHHGSEDANAPLAGARALAERLPNATLSVVDGADHLGTLVRRVDEVVRRQAG